MLSGAKQKTYGKIRYGFKTWGQGGLGLQPPLDPLIPISRWLPSFQTFWLSSQTLKSHQKYQQKYQLYAYSLPCMMMKLHCTSSHTLPSNKQDRESN